MYDRCGLYQLQGLSTERKTNALWFAHFIMGSGTTQMSAVSSIIHRDAVTSSLISLRYGTRFPQSADRLTPAIQHLLAEFKKA